MSVPGSVTRRTALLVGAGALAAPYVRAASASTVQFASVGGITDAPLLLAEENGFFKEAGLTVEMQRLSSAPDLMAATATGQLDAAGISITPGLYASVKRGLALRLVGDKNSLRKGFSATRLVCAPAFAGGDEAANVTSLKGRTVAVSARPSSVYMLLEDVCRKHGMQLTDLNVVELPYPNMQAAFASGAIQAAVHLEPFMTQTIQAGLAKDVCDFTEFTPARGGSIVPVVYGESFIANRGAAQEFMTAYLRGVRIYNDAFAKNIDRDKVIEIIARRARLDAKIVRESFPAGLDPDQVLSRPFIARMQDFFIRQGFQHSPTELDQLIDSSFAEQSVKTLGQYA